MWQINCYVAYIETVTIIQKYTLYWKHLKAYCHHERHFVNVTISYIFVFNLSSNEKEGWTGTNWIGHLPILFNLDCAFCFSVSYGSNSWYNLHGGWIMEYGRGKHPEDQRIPQWHHNFIQERCDRERGNPIWCHTLQWPSQVTQTFPASFYNFTKHAARSAIFFPLINLLHEYDLPHLCKPLLSCRPPR